MTKIPNIENTQDFLTRFGTVGNSPSKGMHEGYLEKIASQIELSPEEMSLFKKTDGGSDFSTQLKKIFNEVNSELKSADKMGQKIATGQPIDIHEVMVSMEKAEISYKMLMAVRSKLLNAYQEIMKMNV